MQQLWPTLNNKGKARRAARQGSWAAGLIVLPTTLEHLLKIAMPYRQIFPGNVGPLGGSGWETLNVAAFIAIAIILWRHQSPIAAIVGLTLYWLNRLLDWAGTSNNLWPMVLLTLCFINGIRGSFAHRRLSHSPPPD